MQSKYQYFKDSPVLSKLILVIVFTLLSGCTSVQIDEYEHNKLNGNYSQVKDGLSVSIDPITDHVESKKYFGKDILDAGVLAVHIIIENGSSSENFIFEKDHIAFREGGGLESKTHYVDNEDMRKNEQDAINSQGAGTVGLYVLAPVAVPLYLSGLSDIRNLNDVKHNMISKELKTKIVHPDEKIEGFLYFDIKNPNSLKTNNNRLDVSYSELGNGKQDTFQFNF